MSDFEKYKQTNRNKLTKDIDNYINCISFIFDYNFIPGSKIIKENQYIEKIMQPICIREQTKNQMEKIIKVANTYIDERIKKGC